MRVHDVEAPVSDQRPESPNPAGAARAVQAVHPQAGALELAHERVLPRKEVGGLVVIPAPVEMGRRAGEQLLGAAPPEPLDQHQNALHRPATSP
jgi:hypothetical protein